ncbi:AAA family ATPase [Nonomuraea sp. NPDC049714]|uniref:AAA family ATPase n=1 Tax=Nonomuraea sp. NPDC049714 TaxID=3364357 RepID=UPI0037AE5EC5
MTTDGAVPGLLRERELAAALEAQGYFADEGLCTAIHLALRLGRPLLLEGEPGVGKTEVASVLSRVTGLDLIRLQCFEGLDSGQALYEWDYPKQLLQVRVAESRGQDVGDLYREEFLLRRPLLRAVRAEQGAVLLIDEVDRADSEFEAFLLEFLGDFQITIPELGTVRARTPPIVVLTSNRTRELHDALKRRCLYHWIAFPEPDRERAILRMAVPGLAEQAAAGLVGAVQRVRRLPLLKRPGIAESVEWGRGAMALAEGGSPWPVALRRALGLLIKDEEDTRLLLAHAEDVFGDALAHAEDVFGDA